MIFAPNYYIIGFAMPRDICPSTVFTVANQHRKSFGVICQPSRHVTTLRKFRARLNHSNVSLINQRRKITILITLSRINNSSPHSKLSIPATCRKVSMKGQRRTAPEMSAVDECKGEVNFFATLSRKMLKWKFPRIRHFTVTKIVFYILIFYEAHALTKQKQKLVKA